MTSLLRYAEHALKTVPTALFQLVRSATREADVADASVQELRFAVR